MQGTVIGIDQGAGFAAVMVLASTLKRVLWCPGSSQQATAVGEDLSPEQRTLKASQLVGGFPLPSQVVVESVENLSRHPLRLVVWAVSPSNIEHLLQALGDVPEQSMFPGALMVSAARGFDETGETACARLRTAFPRHRWAQLTGVMFPMAKSGRDPLSLRVMNLAHTQPVYADERAAFRGAGIRLSESSQVQAHVFGSALAQATSFLSGALCSYSWPENWWAQRERRNQVLRTMVAEILPDDAVMDELFRRPAFLADFLHGIWSHKNSWKAPRAHKAGRDWMNDSIHAEWDNPDALISHRFQDTRAGIRGLHSFLGCPGPDRAPIWNALVDFVSSPVTARSIQLRNQIRPYFDPRYGHAASVNQGSDADLRLESIRTVILWTVSYLTRWVPLHPHHRFDAGRSEPTRASIAASVVAEVLAVLPSQDQAKLVQDLTRGALLLQLMNLGMGSFSDHVGDSPNPLPEACQRLGLHPIWDPRLKIVGSALKSLRDLDRTQNALRRALEGSR